MNFVVISVAGDALLALSRAALEWDEQELSVRAFFVSSDHRPLPLAEIRDSLETADFVLVDLMGVSEPALMALDPLLDACPGHRVVIGYGCRDKTRLGKFSMGSMGSKEDPGPDGQGGLATMSKMRAMTHGMRRMLPLPLLRDMENVFLIGDYWQSGQTEDMRNLLRLLFRTYFGKKNLPKPAPPLLQTGIYLCDPATRRVYPDLAAYRKDHPATSEKPTIGLCFYGHDYPNSMYPIVCATAERLSEFANLVPVAFANQLDRDMETLQNLLTGAPVDLLINFMPFRLGAGPMGGDAKRGVTLLEELGVPCLEPFYLSKQTCSEWEANEKGASAPEFLISMMLPELDGGIETVPLGVMGEPVHNDILNCDLSFLEPLPDALDRLIARVRRHLALQQKDNAEKRIALISYHYPPGDENLFHAAFLDTFASLENILRTLKDNGYQTEALQAEELQALFTTGHLGNYDEAVSPCTAERPFYHGTVISGVRLGNVFLGVQPLRAEDPQDAVTAYHDQKTAPPERYCNFYQYLHKEFQADALVHVGTHGTLEFLPGKERGITPGDWADRLLMDLPHFYYYYTGNASEGMTAKRRANAALLTYAPPAFRESGLYGEYAEIQDLLTELHEAAAMAPAREATLTNTLKKKAEKLGLPKEEDQLERELYRMQSSLIPDGLHVIDDNSDGRELTALLHALDGAYIPVGPMGDVHRNPKVLPSGRNGVAFDPRFIPSPAAFQRGEEIAKESIRRYTDLHGAPPQKTALVLWGLETAQTQGETLGQLMYYLGLTMTWKGTSFLSRIRVIPTEEMDRRRMDVTITICGFFRDLFPNLVTDLTRALRELDELHETPEQSEFARATERRYLTLYQEGMDPDEARALARCRIFGPRNGEYGSALPDLIRSGEWESEEELASLFTAELGYLYDESGNTRRNHTMLRSALSDVDLITQVRSSTDYEITDLDHYFEFFGGLARAVEATGGSAPEAFFVDTNGTEIDADTAGESCSRAIRTRLLNPVFYDGLLAHPYHGGQKLADRFTNVLGLSASLHCVTTEDYDRLSDTYVRNEDVRRRVAANNRDAYLKMLGTLLEANRRGYWDADETRLRDVKQAYLDTEGDLESETT